MNKVIKDAIKHYEAKAAWHRRLMEKAEAEVKRLEALAKWQDENPIDDPEEAFPMPDE